MFRSLCTKVFKNLLPSGNINSFNGIRKSTNYIQRANISLSPQDHDESDTDFDDRMECYFSRLDIDGWELRKGLNDLAGMDAVPEPRVLAAALCACRRVNDFALTIRILEMVKCKCGPRAPVIYPWVIGELNPLLKELGIDTPEELGYGLPELALQSVYDM